MLKGSLTTKSKLIQVALEKANVELEKSPLSRDEKVRIYNAICKAMNPLLAEQIKHNNGKRK